MTQHMRDGDGQIDTLSDAAAREWYHAFTMAVYLCPLIGAALSEGLLGKYTTILRFSCLYCLGHAALAVDETRLGLLLGLVLISLGAGGIKPCVSAHVGDQFCARNQRLLSVTYSYFYMSINLGAFFAHVLSPILLDRFSPHVAFGVRRRTAWHGSGGVSCSS